MTEYDRLHVTVRELQSGVEHEIEAHPKDEIQESSSRGLSVWSHRMSRVTFGGEVLEPHATWEEVGIEEGATVTAHLLSWEELLGEAGPDYRELEKKALAYFCRLSGGWTWERRWSLDRLPRCHGITVNSEGAVLTLGRLLHIALYSSRSEP